AHFDGLQMRHTWSANHLITKVDYLRMAAEREGDARRDGGKTMAVRTVPSFLLIFATVVAWLVLCQIDPTLLQLPFADEPTGTAPLIALLIAVGQSVTAHIVGAFRTHIAYARGARDHQLEHWKLWMTVCFVSAMTSEAVLGLVRLGRTGQILS